MNDLYKELFERAVKAAENSYSPYSRFKVGAALLCSDGTIYTGCNIENSSFSLTNCAEQPFSRQYQKERKNLRLLLLPEVMTI